MNTWNRKTLKEKGKDRMRSNYWKAVLAGIVVTIINGGMAGITGASSGNRFGDFGTAEADSLQEAIAGIPSHIFVAIGILTALAILSLVVIFCLLHVLLLNPLEIGCNRFYYMNLIENADIKEVCYTYDKGYKNGVEILFFRDLYLVLWSLLFVIPGIIKLYEYRMIPYILTENPQMPKGDAFALSKKMMKGNKRKAFLLDLSFLPWDILAAFTLGILNIFYVTPYKKSTGAALYQALKNEVVMRGEQ